MPNDQVLVSKTGIIDIKKFNLHLAYYHSINIFANYYVLIYLALEHTENSLPTTFNILLHLALGSGLLYYFYTSRSLVNMNGKDTWQYKILSLLIMVVIIYEFSRPLVLQLIFFLYYMVSSSFELLGSLVSTTPLLAINDILMGLWLISLHNIVDESMSNLYRIMGIATIVLVSIVGLVLGFTFSLIAPIVNAIFFSVLYFTN